MSEYIVKPEDIIGKINGIPIEIVQKMVDYQNIPNVKVFQKDATAEKELGGFTWIESPEGGNFWYNVVNLRQFNIFFGKYPIITDTKLEYPQEIYDRAIKNLINIERYNNPSDAFHKGIENNHIYRWFCWKSSIEGEKYWDDVCRGKIILSKNYKITYHVENRLQKQETCGITGNDSGRSGCESRNAKACSSILYYGNKTISAGEKAIIEGFENAISASNSIHYRNNCRG